MNFAKFLRTPLFTEQLQWLFLDNSFQTAVNALRTFKYTSRQFIILTVINLDYLLTLLENYFWTIISFQTMDVIRKFIPGVLNVIGVFIKKCFMLSDNSSPKDLNIFSEPQKSFLRLMIPSKPIWSNSLFYQKDHLVIFLMLINNLFTKCLILSDKSFQFLCCQVIYFEQFFM